MKTPAHRARPDGARKSARDNGAKRSSDPRPSGIARFIRDNNEAIVDEWEAFARTLPIASTMDVTALRDHAKQMLEVIVTDLETRQTSTQQDDKAQGKSDEVTHAAERSAAQEHGAGRAESGFDISQMVSEFRALRASVVRLWTAQRGAATREDLEDMIRFNEAIDQAIAESITRFAKDIGESKERFLAILGHDLRTPLGAVMTSTKFMLEVGDLEEPNLTLVRRMSASATRMNHMVLDLLDFTRTRFGDAIPIVRATTDLRRLVHDVVNEVATMYPSSPVQVESMGDLTGEWDCQRLTQALTNLVGNAAQHGSDKSPIKVSAQGREREVVISVQNEGPVIPEAEVSALFAPMKAGPAGRDRRHLGLGLYIVDKIVAAHNGSIAVRSSRDEGTTFEVRLPRG